MNNPITSLPFTIALVMLFNPLNYTVAQESVCHPTFSEIFNFNIGDKFNYITIFSYWDGFSLSGNFERYSFEVTEKLYNDDTTMYIISGAIPPCIALGNFCNRDELSCEKQIRDTILLIDSVAHFLNYCPDSSPIINLPEKDSIYANIDVINYNEDTILSKIASNFRWYNDEGYWENSIFYSDFYDEWYAAGMGLVEMHALFHEAMYDTYLERCIISGDTFIVNVVTDLQEPIKNDIEEFTVFPNPAREIVSIMNNSGIPIRAITIRTINGVYINMENYSVTSDRINLYISDLPKGLYLLEIDTGDSRVNHLLMHF